MNICYDFFFNFPNWEKIVENIRETNWWKHLMNSLLAQSVRWRKLAIIFLTLHHASGSTFYGTEYANRLESLMNLSSTCIWAASGYALIRQATSIKGIVLSITCRSCMYLRTCYVSRLDPLYLFFVSYHLIFCELPLSKVKFFAYCADIPTF